MGLAAVEEVNPSEEVNLSAVDLGVVAQPATAAQDDLANHLAGVRRTIPRRRSTRMRRSRR